MTRVEWGTLYKMMDRMGVYEGIDNINMCLESVSFLVSFKKAIPLIDFFFPKRD